MTTTTQPVSLITAAGHTVLSGRVDLPAFGAWTAFFEIDVDVPPATGDPVEVLVARQPKGTATKALPLLLEGTCLWSAPFSGRSRIEIIGGAGGLRKAITARGYAAGALPLPLLSLVADIMSDTGEMLALGVSAALAPYTVTNWSRVAGSGAAALGRLCREFGLVWRVLFDGTIHIGTDDYPAVAYNPDKPGNPYLPDPNNPAKVAPAPFVADPGDDGAHRVLAVAPEEATLLPSTTVLSRKVIRVVYELEGESLRAELYYQGPDGRTDRDDFERAVRTMLPELPHLPSYDGMITAVRTNTRVEVRCDDASIGEIDNVLLLSATPETSITPTPGQRVRVFFSAGDPGIYYALGFEQDVTATKKVARVGDAVAAGTLTGTVLVSGVPTPVQFVYAPPGVVPGAPSPEADLRGVITTGHPHIMLTDAV